MMAIMVNANDVFLQLLAALLSPLLAAFLAYSDQHLMPVLDYS